MPEINEDGFFRKYDLTREQKQPKTPAAHQHAALDKLHTWFQESKPRYAGGILVLPTGGGKTSTADRFLCTAPIPNGYKVLWLAHTHHLLDQAFYSLESEVKLIHQSNNKKQQLNVRVVSGTKGHFPPSHIESTDDVVIGTLQTVTRAYQNKLVQLNNFLRAAGDKLFVVFDEAHHSPAPSYYKLICQLRENHSKMHLLGLTATPIYTDRRKSGRLNELFPQGILYQVSPAMLMANRILARPVFEECQTTFTPEFNESDYKLWVRDYQDLPEEIITKLAENKQRNAFIAKTYANNKDHYGKTIIFADRWHQCEQLKGFLERQEKGIRVGAIYSHIDANPGRADARNRITKDENSTILEAFRNNQLDVLINIRMLTEGTDIPDVKSVFLTRKTTSKILLTQMVGRALRGSMFGGKDEAYIVSFTDNWQHAINWAEYDQLEETPVAPDVPPVSQRQQMQLISIDLVRRLVRQMDSGVNINSAPFLTLIPLGWYRVEFETLIKSSEDIEIMQRLIMVFENERDSYKDFINYLVQVKLDEFVEPNVEFESRRQQVENWQKTFFSDVGEHIGGDLLANLFHIALHIAQNEKAPPDWFDFEQRNEHDLDIVAQKFIIDEKLSRMEEDGKLDSEYSREDRYWKIIYHSYELFKSQYNACAEWLLANRNRGGNPGVCRPGFDSKLPPPPELSDEDKRLVKERDKYHCLCCGVGEIGHRLEVDHINPQYFGGSHLLDNLQTLCHKCNQVKGIGIIDFRIHQTPLTAPQSKSPKLTLGESNRERTIRSINFFYYCAAVKSVEISRDVWELSLHAGNNPSWLIPHLKKTVKEFQQARSKDGLVGQQHQVRIYINAPGYDVVDPIQG